MQKKALIIGITSQDGYYLSKLLINKNYIVHGTTRKNVDIPNVILHYLDLTDVNGFYYLMELIKPDEVYNLAAISSVSESFSNPKLVSEVNGFSVLNFLEVIKDQFDCKFYQSSTSELFGMSEEVPQTEKTKFHPRSPYAISKLYAHSMVVYYREAYGLHASNGILYNHCSPQRRDNFVEKKIINGILDIKENKQDKLSMGNLYSQRDWGYSPDFVLAMWLMLQQEQPDDYIIATGVNHTIKEFINEVCLLAEIDLQWEGNALNEVALYNDKIVIDINPQLYRPSDVTIMQGDYSKAKNKLNWSPSINFKQLIEIMYIDELKKRKNNILK